MCPVDLGCLKLLSCCFFCHKYRPHPGQTEDKIKLIGKGKMVTIRIKLCYQVVHLWKPLMSNFPLQLVLILCGTSIRFLCCFVSEITPVKGYVLTKTEYLSCMVPSNLNLKVDWLSSSKISAYFPSWQCKLKTFVNISILDLYHYQRNVKKSEKFAVA